jgi:outer membrane murein-binding lipoprotein Lpp
MSNSINQRFDNFSGELRNLSTKVDNLSDKVDNLSDKYNKLSDKVDNLSNKYDKLSDKVDNLSVQVKENTSLLIALEENAKITRAEVEKISNDVVHIKGDVQALRKDLTNVEIITSSNWTEIAKLKAVK